MKTEGLSTIKLFTLPEHINSLPVFSGVRVARSLVFCVVFCRSLFVLFLLAIVLLILLQLTNYDFLFGVFKLFLAPPLFIDML